jgi:phage tail-like protein
MPGTRAFAAGRFSLQLDGVDCGFVQAVSGGAVTADVVTVPAQGSGFEEKHLGQVRYEEIALQLDLSCDARVYDWIAASLTRQFLRKDGSIVATDAAGKAVSEQAFSDGLVTEVTVPRLDGASKEPCYLTVEVAPETTQLKKGSGKAVKPIAVKKKQQWLASNFKLEIDGLETKTREQLTFLAADGKTRLGALSFFNLGIFRLAPEPRAAGAETVARLVADLYCERMELAVP